MRMFYALLLSIFFVQGSLNAATATFLNVSPVPAVNLDQAGKDFRQAVANKQWDDVEVMLNRFAIEAATPQYCSDPCVGCRDKGACFDKYCTDPYCCQSCTVRCHSCIPCDASATCVPTESCNTFWQDCCGQMPPVCDAVRAKIFGQQCSTANRFSLPFSLPPRWICPPVCRTPFLKKWFYGDKLSSFPDCCDKACAKLVCFSATTKRCCCFSSLPNSLERAIEHFKAEGRIDVLEQIKVVVAYHHAFSPVAFKEVVDMLGIDPYVYRGGVIGAPKDIRDGGISLVQADSPRISAGLPVSGGSPSYSIVPTQQTMEMQAEANFKAIFGDLTPVKRAARADGISAVMAQAGWGRALQRYIHSAALATAREIVPSAERLLPGSGSGAFSRAIDLAKNTLAHLLRVGAEALETLTVLPESVQTRRRFVCDLLKYVEDSQFDRVRFAAITSSWNEKEVTDLLKPFIVCKAINITALEDEYKKVWQSKVDAIESRPEARFKLYYPALRPHGSGAQYRYHVRPMLEMYNIHSIVGDDPLVMDEFAHIISDQTGRRVCLVNGRDALTAGEFRASMALLSDISDAIVLVDGLDMRADDAGYADLIRQVKAERGFPVIVTTTSQVSILGDYEAAFDVLTGDDVDADVLSDRLFNGILLGSGDDRVLLEHDLANDSGILLDKLERLVSDRRTSQAKRFVAKSFIARGYLNGTIPGGARERLEQGMKALNELRATVPSRGSRELKSLQNKVNLDRFILKILLLDHTIFHVYQGSLLSIRRDFEWSETSELLAEKELLLGDARKEINRLMQNADNLLLAFTGAYRTSQEASGMRSEVWAQGVAWAQHLEVRRLQLQHDYDTFGQQDFESAIGRLSLNSFAIESMNEHFASIIGGSSGIGESAAAIASMVSQGVEDYFSGYNTDLLCTIGGEYDAKVLFFILHSYMLSLSQGYTNELFFAFAKFCYTRLVELERDSDDGAKESLLRYLMIYFDGNRAEGDRYWQVATSASGSRASVEAEEKQGL